MNAITMNAPAGKSPASPLAKDVELAEAWREYQTSRILFSLPPIDDIEPGQHQTPSERALEDRFTTAEETIASATPTTLRGVEIQLWLYLAQIQDSEIIPLCAVREDIRYFADAAELDFPGRLIVRALQGVLAVQEGGVA